MTRWWVLISNQSTGEETERERKRAPQCKPLIKLSVSEELSAIEQVNKGPWANSPTPAAATRGRCSAWSLRWVCSLPRWCLCLKCMKMAPTTSIRAKKMALALRILLVLQDLRFERRLLLLANKERASAYPWCSATLEASVSVSVSISALVCKSAFPASSNTLLVEDGSIAPSCRNLTNPTDSERRAPGARRDNPGSIIAQCCWRNWCPLPAVSTLSLSLICFSFCSQSLWRFDDFSPIEVNASLSVYLRVSNIKPPHAVLFWVHSQRRCQKFKFNRLLNLFYERLGEYILLYIFYITKTIHLFELLTYLFPQKVFTPTVFFHLSDISESQIYTTPSWQI